MAKKESAPSVSSPDDYPPTGHFNPSHLKKMGIKGTPQIGDRFPVHARVTGVNEHPDGGHSVSVELEKMVKEAEQKAAKGNIQEGNLSGAKAAMDQALDEQEMSSKANKKHAKEVGRKK